MSDLELDITGMTCAACANRIERKLNKLEGGVAQVNYTTEKAKVTFPADVAPTIMHLIGIPPPAERTGPSLISE